MKRLLRIILLFAFAVILAFVLIQRSNLTTSDLTGISTDESQNEKENVVPSSPEIIPSLKPTVAPTPEPTPEPVPNPYIDISAQHGDTVLFGRFEQDYYASTGLEPIEWFVLANEDDRMLLFSKYGLKNTNYSYGWGEVTWETSYMREWCNNDFYNVAFTDDEKDWIQKSLVKASRNPEGTVDPGNDTEDNVFILSLQEYYEYLTEFEMRECKATFDAIKHNSPRAARWWLRTPGKWQYTQTLYNNLNDTLYDGDNYEFHADGVDNKILTRPTIWVSKYKTQNE